MSCDLVRVRPTLVLYVSLLSLCLMSCSPCAKRHLLPYVQRPAATQLRHSSVLYRSDHRAS